MAATVDTPPAPAGPRRIVIAPCPTAEVARLEAALGISGVVAQVLVRRGLGDPAAARAFLAAEERHPPSALAGLDEALAVIRRHVAAGTRITVHGDYDVDGVCSTAVLVRALRALGADVDPYLPSRLDDGYGLSLATVERLAARGTALLVTVDCGVTAVDEVAAARAAGLDVVVTDHHQPRADGVLPDAALVHPALRGYPCPELCATAVAHKLAEALGAPTAAADLDLVALATVADVVALRGENRRLVREGLRALATTAKPGLRALMRVARVDPVRLDATAIGFRLAPRLNAAGRLGRADAALELVLTDDAERAEAVADELDRRNAERRQTSQQVLFAAEAQVAEQGERAAYVVAGEGWHPGVAGIVAGRLAERHHRPVIVVALDPAGGTGTGSGRSIPGFDLLAGLDACAGHLLRHGGHRAAAGLEVTAAGVGAFRDAFAAHAEAVLGPDDLVPEERVDAVVAGDELGLALAEELEALAPFGHGNPAVRLLVPAARVTDPRPMGEGRHVRFTVEAGAARCRGVAFGGGARLPVEVGAAADLACALELDAWNGAVEPRLVLHHAASCAPAPVALVGEPEDALAAALAELDAPADAPAPPAVPAGPGLPGGVRDRRDRGVAGTIAALVASGEPVLVVCADARRRRDHLAGRLGGFRLCSWLALERDPALAADAAHVVALDPPGAAAQRALVGRLARGRVVHLAWGAPERGFAAQAHERAWDLRPAAAAVYRALRAGAPLGAAALAAGCPAAGGRALRVLAELGLVDLDRVTAAAHLPQAERTELEGSASFRAAQRRLGEGRALLGDVSSPAVRAA